MAKKQLSFKHLIADEFSVRIYSRQLNTQEKIHECQYICNCIYLRANIYLYNRKCNWFYTWSNILNVIRYVEASSALTAVLRCERLHGLETMVEAVQDVLCKRS